ncbi:MAG TPA: electron transport complex subunit RsxB [Thiotrichales bacterium]|nr:electron transport complex subunit RsxB [Thiotrichales bacterium]
MLTAVLAIGVLAGLFGLLLGWSAIRFHVEADPIVDQINAILPQTQCGQCGFAGCRPYAEAIAAGEAEINRCPPGGEAVMRALADLLGRDPVPLDESRGEQKEKQVAVIDEQLCIGCTLCIQACPVDAILGAAKHMHTVIEEECTGCELCVEPCPVDCIHMVPVKPDINHWRWPSPEEKRVDIARPPRAAGEQT